MKKCLSTDSDRSGSEGTPFIVNGQDVARRFAVATLLVACLLPTVLLVGVCSYVHREMLLVDSQLRQVMRDCSYCCSHPVVSIEAVSPAQVNVKLPSVFAPRPFRSQERTFQYRTLELSILGTFASWNFRSSEL